MESGTILRILDEERKGRECVLEWSELGKELSLTSHWDKVIWVFPDCIET